VPKLAPVITRKTSMLNLVSAGFGIAVIPQRMTMMMSDGLVYRPLDDEDSKARSALVLPLQPTNLARRFAAILEKECNCH